jgi:hypothetical protein
MDRLIGPRLKIARANKHIAEFETARQEFIASDPYTRFSEEDPQTGDLVYRITVEPHAAEGLRDLAIIVGDVVHNLRSSLDLLAWQLVEAHPLGKAPDRFTAFPIWERESQFINGGAGYMDGAHPHAVMVMRSLKPYKGGNATLYRLHRLDATDKHRLLLTVGASPSETLYHFTVGTYTRWVRIAPVRGTVLLEDGAEIFRVPAEAREYFERQPEPEFSLRIALQETETPLALEITSALDQLLGTAAEIIDLFEPFL